MIESETIHKEFTVYGTRIYPCCTGMKEMVDKRIVLVDPLMQMPFYDYDLVRRPIKFCPFCGKAVHNKQRYQ